MSPTNKPPKGVARRKAQSVIGVAIRRPRGRLPARHTQRLRHRAPLLIGSSLLTTESLSTPRSSRPKAGSATKKPNPSELLAGARSGPGGWLRRRPEVSLRKKTRTRRRRTPSRAFKTPLERAPQRTRWSHCKPGSEGGDKVSPKRKSPGTGPGDVLNVVWIATPPACHRAGYSVRESPSREGWFRED